MKKKVLVALVMVLLAATGLAGCSEEKEPDEAAKETIGMQKNLELAEDISDETSPAGEDALMEKSKPENETERQTDYAENVCLETEMESRRNEETEEVESKGISETEETQESVKQSEPESTGKENTKTGKTEQKAETAQSEQEKTNEPDEPEPPGHIHSWEPVYAERQVEQVKLVPWTKCYCCGADMTGNVYHIDQHLLDGESNVHYGTEYREEVCYETETYLSGYRCSCGETKTN